MLKTTVSDVLLTNSTEVDLSAECDFFSKLKMRNGTFKLTQRGRFKDVEKKIAPCLLARNRDTCDLLDIGASTGLTTVEMVDFLERLGTRTKAVGTDLFIDAHFVNLLHRFNVLADEHGWPLQYELGDLPVRSWIRRLDYLTLAFLPRTIVRASLRPIIKRKIDSGRTIPVKMQSRVLHQRNIELIKDDILTHHPSFLHQFDFIRAANVLNLGYFRDAELHQAVSNLSSYCKGTGSLVLVVRSRGSVNDGTLFELMEDGKFSPVFRLGKGSEIEEIVLEASAL